MPSQSCRAMGAAPRSRRVHQAIARKNGSDSVMRRNSRVVALTGCAEYPSLMRTGRNAKDTVPARANTMPQKR